MAANGNTRALILPMTRKAPSDLPLRASQVRIIGGRWRGSRLPVLDVAGLRPTADRVRETLFNWLQAEIPGAQVLDLFAGSGALGFEAASRGAARVDLVDTAPAVAASLRATAARLGRDGAKVEVQVHEQSALAFLAAAEGRRWNLVFVDPPFSGGLWASSLVALSPCLAARAWVYLETPIGAVVPLPSDWVLHREQSTRQLRAALYRVGMD